MNIHRKLQIAAAAVTANGMLALGLMAPSTALANPCATMCIRSFECSSLEQQRIQCQAIAPSGCTVTSTLCLWSTSDPFCFGFGPSGTYCYFQ